MGILEVKHVLTHNNRLAVSRRLQDIVAAMRYHAAANKYNIADAVHLAQLADGVQQHYIMPLRRMLQKLSTGSRGKATLLAHGLNMPRPQHRPGRNQKLCPGMFFPYFRKGCQHMLLLPLVGGAGQKDAVIIRQPQLRQKLLLFPAADIGVGLVELGVAGNCHQLPVGTQPQDILRIHRGLHGKILDSVQHIIPKAMEIAITGHALFADAPVHHHDRNFHFLCRL